MFQWNRQTAFTGLSAGAFAEIIKDEIPLHINKF
jgi:hypothetical protein